MADKRGKDPSPTPRPRRTRAQDRQLVARDLFSSQLTPVRPSLSLNQTTRATDAQATADALPDTAAESMVVWEPQRVTVRVSGASFTSSHSKIWCNVSERTTRAQIPAHCGEMSATIDETLCCTKAITRLCTERQITRQGSALSPGYCSRVPGHTEPPCRV